MAYETIPGREPELVTYVQTFSALVTATPTAFGATALQATTLSGLVTAFVTAYTVATTPATRTKPAIAAKNTAKDAMLANLRVISRVIQAYPPLTDAQREQLGLTVRKTPTPSPIPASAPKLSIVSVVGRTVKVRLEDADVTNRRGKPAHVVGATVFSLVAPAASPDIAAYKFEGNTTLTTFDVAFPATVPAGSIVYLTAFWRNARDESGPACQPIPATLAGGLSMAA